MTDKSQAAKSRYERIPYLVMFEEKSPFKDTYAGEIGRVVLEAHLLRPPESPSGTVVIFMHPIGGGAYLPLPIALAKAGVHVIYCNSRYRNNDTALIMEKVAVDLGACIRDAKERFGYEKIILGGWSGGGSLSLFYQAEAEKPSVKNTPAGDPPDLTGQGFLPADGIMLLAAHVSRAHTLTEWLDASIIEESRPENRDPELDLYNPENPNQPPYDDAFLSRYRKAQIDRNRRISEWVKESLTEFRKRGEPNRELCFVVHGTMADPRWLDPTLDPNDREPNKCFLGDPEVVNNSPVGLARFCSLRSWLSQWSYDYSNADGVACAGRITIPALVLGNSADDACTPSHTHRLYNAISHEHKEIHEISGANHYYFGQSELAAKSADICIEWMTNNNFL